MKLFKKLFQKINNDHMQRSSLKDRINDKINSKKKKIADFLSAKSERLSVSRKKLLLVTFGIVMGGTSLYLLTTPFHATTKVISIAPSPSETPQVIIPDRPENLISHGDYELLVGFRQTLDSLRLYDPFTYQLLLRERQGLIDSLDFLIRLYHDHGKALLNHKSK
jgi:hypothetical protein